MAQRPSSIPPPDAYIDDVFGAGGILAQAAAKAGRPYTVREGQVEMARVVDEVARTGVNRLIEAPTGTGKSFAYAVVATYYATGQGNLVQGRSSLREVEGEPPLPAGRAPTVPRRVVIATSNIALQEQLVQSDLPFLRGVLPWSFTFDFLKGRGNYLCRVRHEEIQGVSGRELYPRAPQLAREHDASMAWAENTSTGDKSEIPDVAPSDLVWAKFSIGEDCPGSACPQARECFARAAQARARAVQVLVVNDHLLCLDAKAGGEILGGYELLIVDEAHKLPDVARDAFGVKITGGSFGTVTHTLETLGGLEAQPLVHALRNAVDRTFFEDLGQHVSETQPTWRIRPEVRIELGGLLTALEAAHRGLNGLLEEIRAGIAEHQARLASAQAHMEGLAEAHGASSRRPTRRSPKAPPARHASRSSAASRPSRGNDPEARIQIALRAVARLYAALKVFYRMPRPLECIYTIERGNSPKGSKRQPKITLRAQAVYPGEDLARMIFAPDLPPAVATSATLATGGDFTFARRELGLEDPRPLVVPTPFDWRGRALAVLPPRSFPNPKDPRYPDAVGQALREIVAQTRGRVLVLFNAHRDKEAAARALQGCGYPVRVQGEESVPRLVQWLRDTPHGVLLGTDSFWTGVDVPGENLSCVVIPRLPFIPPSDPILSELEERDGWKAAFFDYSVPKTVLKFRQGVGRLLRQETDRGVIVVLDSRIATANYGARFLRDLPDLVQVHEISDIGPFLDRGVFPDPLRHVPEALRGWATGKGGGQ